MNVFVPVNNIKLKVMKEIFIISLLVFYLFYRIFKRSTEKIYPVMLFDNVTFETGDILITLPGNAIDPGHVALVVEKTNCYSDVFVWHLGLSSSTDRLYSLEAFCKGKHDVCIRKLRGKKINNNDFITNLKIYKDVTYDYNMLSRHCNYCIKYSPTLSFSSSSSMGCTEVVVRALVSYGILTDRIQVKYPRSLLECDLNFYVTEDYSYSDPVLIRC
jgi:hypothetical protein